eukprot:gnl/TRDRNA2_/TRDRNA2_183972_c0_seq1.p1 gnl/TRDRNA2_/TRDRNA2_183972_c0~~gnl/TRDRNA2_/TRDRNA2_183972_c0_seq1.p1  ORF type:complete len:262 (-),score=45.09 gnl/TRDRNA2_/TRDRNA2_183972_c0_seq1:204-989(-)
MVFCCCCRDYKHIMNTSAFGQQFFQSMEAEYHLRQLQFEMTKQNTIYWLALKNLDTQQVDRLPLPPSTSPCLDGIDLGCDPVFPPPATPPSSAPEEKDVEEGDSEGIHVLHKEVHSCNLLCDSVAWHVRNLSARLKDCLGRPLVSPEFSAAGLQGMRLMVFPDGKDAAKGPRTRKEKESFGKMVTEGPLKGRLRLKVPKCEKGHVVEFYLRMGNVRAGPFRQDFSELSMSDAVDFKVDWLSQVAPDKSLTFGVEISQSPGI